MDSLPPAACHARNKPHQFTVPRFHKPFDPRFRDLLGDVQGLYACIYSDEISVLLAPNCEGSAGG
jgi:hypothetical protein